MPSSNVNGHSVSFFPDLKSQNKGILDSTIYFASEDFNGNETAPNTPIHSETNEIDMSRQSSTCNGNYNYY